MKDKLTLIHSAKTVKEPQGPRAVCMLLALTDDCRDWMEANIGSIYRPSARGHGIVIEARYIDDIHDKLRADGFGLYHDFTIISRADPI